MYKEHHHKSVGDKHPEAESKAQKQEMRVLEIFRKENRPLARWEVYELYRAIHGEVKEHSIVRAISHLLHGTLNSPRYIMHYDRVEGNAGATVNRWILISSPRSLEELEKCESEKQPESTPIIRPIQNPKHVEWEIPNQLNLFL